MANYKELIYLLFLGAFGGLFSAWITRFWKSYNFEDLFRKIGINRKKVLILLRMLIEAIIFLILLFILCVIYPLLTYPY